MDFCKHCKTDIVIPFDLEPDKQRRMENSGLCVSCQTVADDKKKINEYSQKNKLPVPTLKIPKDSPIVPFREKRGIKLLPEPEQLSEVNERTENFNCDLYRKDLQKLRKLDANIGKTVRILLHRFLTESWAINLFAELGWNDGTRVTD